MFFHRYLQFFSELLVKGMFIGVLVLIVAKWLFKRKGTVILYAQNILKWIILCYAIAGLLNTLFLLLIQNHEYATFIDRATGAYAWALWMMLFFSTIFPFLLFHKKLKHSLHFLFIVSILVNFGWLFESFVIHITGMHRDYAPDGFNPYLPGSREISIILHGFILGITSLVAADIFKRASTRG